MLKKFCAGLIIPLFFLSGCGLFQIQTDDLNHITISISMKKNGIYEKYIYYPQIDFLEKYSIEYNGEFYGSDKIGNWNLPKETCCEIDTLICKINTITMHTLEDPSVLYESDFIIIIEHTEIDGNMSENYNESLPLYLTGTGEMPTVFQEIYDLFQKVSAESMEQ